jgi:diaminobutyrate-2-oxoglutarate transaminase
MHSASHGNLAALSLADDDADIFGALESDARSYSRCFPATFTSAKGAHVTAEDGTVYIDFFCGASSLNYGHNHDQIKKRLVDYLQNDGLMHALDMQTTAKRDFLTRFRDVVLRPREMSYKIQFCGPTGTDAVEAALKLARKVTGRAGVIAFSGAYHGMTAGSLSATGNARARSAYGIPLYGTSFLPYESGPWGSFDSVDLLSKILSDSSSGVGIPAAVILEPLQMEGGIYAASGEWLRRLREITSEHGILLITDEIQSGCGRTGTFFCFEQSGVSPDMVTLSKSISGYGLPMSILLMRPELDALQPGEHAGTFRGTQLSFIAATAALDFWEDPAFLAGLEDSGRRLQQFGESLRKADPRVQVRGRGMVLGIDLREVGGRRRAAEAQRACFDRGLILEVCGREDEVVKVMPPLNVDGGVLEAGLDILRSAVLGTTAA